MSITDHPDERERLHQAIAESQRVIDDCPKADNGWSDGECRTCEKYRQQIEDYREALAALDADEAEPVTDDPMALVTRQDWPETPQEPEYVIVPAGEYKHPGDQVWDWLPVSASMGWSYSPMKDWGDRVQVGVKTRRVRALDVHAQTIIDKAERLAKRLADPVQRERLLYTITQQKAALAQNLKLVMQEIENATTAPAVPDMQRTEAHGR